MSDNPATVLVVDDEPSDLEMLRKSLERLGYQVATAGDGFAALQKFERHGRLIKLLVADVAMAPMNGCDLALRLTAKQPDLKVLFVSGFTGAEVLRRGPVQGLNAAYLRKPFTFEQLAAKVHELSASTGIPSNLKLNGV